MSPDEDPLVLHVHLVQCQSLQGRHRGVLGTLGNGEIINAVNEFVKDDCFLEVVKGRSDLQY